MKNSPVWQDTRTPRFDRLDGSRRFDVVVVGGGITGLTAAYLLKQNGKTVAVVERDRIVSGDTGHTTAHLTYVTDKRLTELAKSFGEQTAGRVWEAGRAAIDKIEEIVAAERISCDFQRVPGFLHARLDSDRDDSEELRDEAALATKLAFCGTFQSAVPYFKKPGVLFADQAKFNPAAFLSNLAKKINDDGSMIFEDTEITEFESDPLRVIAGEHHIECDYVVICTHVPLVGNAGIVGASILQTRLYPYTSYVLGATMRRGLLPEASFWDTGDPYYYLRIDRRQDGDYLIFGGRDHKTGQEPNLESRFNELTEMLHHWLPEARIDRRWSGQVIETNDGLPFIGETADHQFAATGFAGNGMTFGVFAAMMACESAQGRRTGWHGLFDPACISVRGGTLDYVMQNVDFPYYFLRDRIAPPNVETVEDIRRNDGAVVKIDGQRVACFRDSHGHLTRLSPVCTHLGCIVRWNTAEKTWDCPCHGSRFRSTGEVIAGPAETSLAPVESTQQEH